jgi:diadenosine tetraphosphatase ApaH/serine/threonine PP2A family protein phosphatase
VVGDFTLTHGSLVDPVWEYATSAQVAAASMLQQTTPWCLVGHAHLPLAFERPARGGGVTARTLTEGETIKATGRRVLINPGSVGQPRDGDPRAAYALVDTEAEALTPYRVTYDVLEVQQRMRAAGLPEALSHRLTVGR